MLRIVPKIAETGLVSAWILTPLQGVEFQICTSTLCVPAVWNRLKSEWTYCPFLQLPMDGVPTLLWFQRKQGNRNYIWGEKVGLCSISSKSSPASRVARICRLLTQTGSTRCSYAATIFYTMPSAAHRTHSVQNIIKVCTEGERWLADISS